jgi:hypothetical protein
VEKEPKEPQAEPQQSEGGQDEPPPFDPDPRLVTYLERGRKSDAERRFREATEAGPEDE